MAHATRPSIHNLLSARVCFTMDGTSYNLWHRLLVTIVVENRSGFARTVVSFGTENLVILVFELAFTRFVMTSWFLNSTDESMFRDENCHCDDITLVDIMLGVLPRNNSSDWDDFNKFVECHWHYVSSEQVDDLPWYYRFLILIFDGHIGYLSYISSI